MAKPVQAGKSKVSRQVCNISSVDVQGLFKQGMPKTMGFIHGLDDVGLTGVGSSPWTQWWCGVSEVLSHGHRRWAAQVDMMGISGNDHYHTLSHYMIIVYYCNLLTYAPLGDIRNHMHCIKILNMI